MKRGFTLIELLVVISIISFLTSVVLVSLQGAKNRAQASRIVSEVRQVKQAMEAYRNANGFYFKNNPGDSFVRNFAGYESDMNTMTAALSPYIKLDKISFISDKSTSMHYTSERARALSQYGSASLLACGGVTIKDDGYIIGFYSPLLTNEFKRWDYASTFFCITND